MSHPSLQGQLLLQPHLGQYSIYSLLTILVLELACLISYLPLPPFNTPKEPIKMHYVASLKGRGTFLLVQYVYQFIVNMAHGKQHAYCIDRHPR
jgi:hypothetical protein